jgi:hypothetical protein
MAGPLSIALSIAPSRVKKHLDNGHPYRYDHMQQQWISEVTLPA